MPHVINNTNTLKLLNEPQQFLTEITVQPEHGQGSNTPVHIIIVGDVSGSMAEKRIEAEKKAIRQILPMLRPADSISIIKFNTSAEIICQCLTIANLAEIEEKIESLNAGGGTQISTGIRKALEITNTKERAVIVLFSDGESHTPDADFQAAALAGKMEIQIYAAGIGADSNEGQKNLSETARLSGGYSEYLKTPEEIQPFLAQCFKTAQSNTWQHVALEIQTIGGAEIMDYAKHAPIIDPSKLSNPTKTHRVAIGNVSAEEPYKAIAKILVPPRTQAGTYLIGKATATYTERTAQKRSEAEIKINFSNIVPAQALGSVDEAYIRIEAKRAEKRGDLQTTKRLYETIRDKKMTSLAERISTGTASTDEKVQFEAGSTRRAKRS